MPAYKTGPTLFDWALLAMLGLIWGAAFFGVEMGLDSLPPLWVSTGRIVLAAILLTAIAFIWGDGLPGTRTALDRRVWLHCFGMGMFTNAIVQPAGMGATDRQFRICRHHHGSGAASGSAAQSFSCT